MAYMAGRLMEELGLIPNFSPSDGFELGFGFSLAMNMSFIINKVAVIT